MHKSTDCKHSPLARLTSSILTVHKKARVCSKHSDLFHKMTHMHLRGIRFWILLNLLFTSTGLLANEASALFAKWLPGTYSCEAFAKKDPTRSDVRIHILTIWEEAKDGPWLYLEQALVTKLDKPYRQAVLHIVGNPDGSFTVENWDLKDKAAWIGSWRTPEKLKTIKREDITAFRTYLVFHKEADGNFKGGTPADKVFENHFRGAVRFTNESALTPTTFYSWDRGWGADGKVVWGPEDGGYFFDKLPDTSL